MNYDYPLNLAALLLALYPGIDLETEAQVYQDGVHAALVWTAAAEARFGPAPSPAEIAAAASAPGFVAGPVPESVTRYQARAWIFVRGLSLNLWTTASAMDAFMLSAIESQPGLTSAEREVAKIKWSEAAAIERFDPLVAALGPVLGLQDQAAIDQALREAAAIA